MKTISFTFLAILVVMVSCSKSDHRISDSDSFVLEEANPYQIDSTESEDINAIRLPDKFFNVSSLKTYLNECSDSDKYAQGIIGRIAEYSLDYANRLLHNEYSRFIVVDKSRMKVVLFDKYGREEKTYGMACAKKYGSKHKKADSRTPEGYFAAEGIYDSTDWLFTDDEGVTSDKKGQFGPRFIRLKGGPYTHQIGIHGTVAPWSIGARASHGCIRITNENILELVELVEVGMPIIVVPGRKDMIVNKEEGYDIPWIPTTLTASEPKIPKNIEKKEETSETDIIEKKDSVETPATEATEEQPSENSSVTPEVETPEKKEVEE